MRVKQPVGQSVRQVNDTLVRPYVVTGSKCTPCYNAHWGSAACPNIDLAVSVCKVPQVPQTESVVHHMLMFEGAARESERPLPSHNKLLDAIE